MKHIEVVAAIIERDGQYFATQKGYGEFKGGWEFPGGKIEAGESKEEALNRIREKLGENAYIINGWDEDNPFRASFTVKVDSEDIEKITSLVENLDGVHSVEFMHIGNPYELFIINILMYKS